MPDFTLQVLHTSDLEGGVDAIDAAPNFAAIVDLVEENPLVDASITLSAGDNFLPGPFLNASGDRAAFRDSGLFNDIYNDLYGVTTFDSLREGGGRVDISIMNIIGFDASAIGNHEFDLGSDAFEGIIEEDFRDPAGPGGDRWIGAQFPYLSANLDFSADGDLGNLFTSDILETTAFQNNPASANAGDGGVPKIAPATIINEGGERVGVVGATTQILSSITSPTGTTVIGPDSNDMPALAAVLQPTIDAIVASGVNKVILVSHLQQFALEQELIGLLSGVDIVIAGGSDTLNANADDVLRPGDVADQPYPFVTTNADGDPAVVVSTDGEYSYVGQLVVDFDANGILVDATDTPIDSIDDLNLQFNGPIATTDANVNALYAAAGAGNPFAAGNKGELVRRLTDAVSDVVQTQDGNVFGESSVFLEGRREFVRTEETNFGNLSADANLTAARLVDTTVQVSIKNGGGIRAPIGEVDSNTGALLPPQANPASGKEVREISQLDIDNSLRFNNGLTLITLTAEQLLQVLEHGVAETGPGNTPGQFAQVGGVRFSFDPDLAPNSRVRNVAITAEDGTVIPVVEDGLVRADAPQAIRIVTLNFLANGGDDYPFQDFVDADPVFANRVDIQGERDANNDGILDPGEDLNQNGVFDAPIAEPAGTGVADFADFGSEQDALAEYLADTFPAVDGGNSATPFSAAETPIALDQRIQNLSVRTTDTVFSATTDGTIDLTGTDQGDNNVLVLTGAISLELSVVQVSVDSSVEVVAIAESDGTETSLLFTIGGQSGLPGGLDLTTLVSTQQLDLNSYSFGFRSTETGELTTLEISSVTASGFVLSGGGVEITVGVSAGAASSFVTVEESLNITALLAADIDSDQQVSIEVDIFRESALDNFVGFYAVDALTGAVLDSTGSAVTGAPTTADRVAYLQAAVDNALFGEASPANNGITSLDVTLDFSVLGTDIEILPFIIADGDPGSIGGDLENVYTTFLGVNSDGVDHVRRLGDSTYGFEDINGGGDNDFDDIVLTVKAVADV